jgi:trehalose utilization protein
MCSLVGHTTHAGVQDAVVDRAHQRGFGGMRLLALHSTHFSKLFRRLMGTSGSGGLVQVGRD